MKPVRFVIGLTGGLGSGKSTVLGEFKKRGHKTIDLDQIAHSQAKPGKPVFGRIVNTFGRQILDSKGCIDRQALGRIIFKNKNLRNKLERLTHTSILTEMRKNIQRSRGIVVVDVPLLFEKRLEKNFDTTLLISCSTQNQIKRTLKRDKLSLLEIKRRIKAQWPMRKKMSLADTTLNNDGSIAAIIRSVRVLANGLELLYGGRLNGNTA